MTKGTKKELAKQSKKGSMANSDMSEAAITSSSDDYAVQSRRTESAENDQIVKESMMLDGHVKFRLNPQIYDAKNTRYIGLLGQQVRIKVYRADAVIGLMDGIDALIEAGTVVPMDKLIAMLRNAVAESQKGKK